MKLPVLQGPLGELAAPIDPSEVPVRPVHARVLELDPPDAGWRALACFFDPGGALALHRALRPRIEATLLLEQCAVPELSGEMPGMRGLSLTVWPSITDVDRATAAFGLVRTDPDADRAKRTVARMRGEASALHLRIADAPSAYFEATFSAPTDAATALDHTLEGRFREPWGVRPGAPAELVLEGREPSFAALDALADACVPRETELLRAIPPRIFLAMCDLAGVAAMRELGIAIEWSDCSATSDEHDDFAPPPMLRFASAREGEVIVPIAEELLRFCVMPLRAGETVPPVSEYLRALLT